jgi:hypothetical protein
MQFDTVYNKGHLPPEMWCAVLVCVCIAFSSRSRQVRSVLQSLLLFWGDDHSWWPRLRDHSGSDSLPHRQSSGLEHRESL